MLTHKSMTESCLYQGSSNSHELFQLVLCLRRLEMTTRHVSHVVHCTGTRMITQGTNGLSRENFHESVMKKDDVPLHWLALERSPQLKGRFKGMFRYDKLEELSPEDWFQQGHGIRLWCKSGKGLWYPNLKGGTYMWHPPASGG
jgi:hypothetical protein